VVWGQIYEYPVGIRLDGVDDLVVKLGQLVVDLAVRADPGPEVVLEELLEGADTPFFTNDGLSSP
jgi:hypothetical protein